MKKAMNDAVRDYLVAIGKVPLLSREQEVELSQKVQELLPLLAVKEAMESDIGFTLSDEQWAITAEIPLKELQRKVRQGELAKKKLIESNLRLVVSIAKKYLNRGLELLDLIQEGSIGLTRAVEKFDPSKGYKFSTYAYWWIRQGITRGIQESSRTIRLPIHIYEKLNKVKRIRREIAEKYQRTATFSEIAEVMETTSEEISELMKLTIDSCSFDIMVGDEENSTLLDFIADQSYSCEDVFNQLHYEQESLKCLETISSEEQRILWARFVENKPFRVIAQEFGVSHERIRQRQTKALRKVRQRANVAISG